METIDAAAPGLNGTVSVHKRRQCRGDTASYGRAEAKTGQLSGQGGFGVRSRRLGAPVPSAGGAVPQHVSQAPPAAKRVRSATLILFALTYTHSGRALRPAAPCCTVRASSRTTQA